MWKNLKADNNTSTAPHYENLGLLSYGVLIYVGYKVTNICIVNTKGKYLGVLSKSIFDMLQIWILIWLNKDNVLRYEYMMKRLARASSNLDICNGITSRKSNFVMPKVLQENEVQFSVVSVTLH